MSPTLECYCGEMRLPMNNELVIAPGKYGELLRKAGIERFDDLWNLPRDFIEPPNKRRGGWSGVITLSPPAINGEEPLKLYVKRQENQPRYSWRHPLGQLTYAYELKALLRWHERHYPAIHWAGYGFRKKGRDAQGIMVTVSPPGNYRSFSTTKWDADELPLEVFRNAGECLYRFHREGWQHGALYPDHTFMDRQSGELLLIDLERSRRQWIKERAVYNDFYQFFKRMNWLSVEAVNALLNPYRRDFSGALRRLAIENYRPAKKPGGRSGSQHRN